MLYPKIPTKSIALLLICLIFTVAAVGIMFLIYFFHSNGNFIDNFRDRLSNPDGSYHHHADAEEFGSYTHFLANDINSNGNNHHRPRHFPSTTYHKQGFKYASKNINNNIHNNNHNSVDNRLINNGDTIYIDDYDKINEKSVINVDGDLDITSIEYFNQIISDHTGTGGGSNGKGNQEQFDNSNSKRFPIGNTKENVVVFTKEIDETGANNHVLRQSPKIIQTRTDIRTDTIDNDNQDDDDDDDDNDDDDAIISSGSGDFTNDSEDSSYKKTKLTQFYKNQDSKENLYSVSSEFVSNLSPPINISGSTITKGERATTIQPTSDLGQINRTTDAEGIQQITSTQFGGKKITITRQGHHPGLPRPDQYRRGGYHKNGAWLETRARRIMGNVKKSEERSRQLLLCEEAGGGELCRMLFKGHINE